MKTFKLLSTALLLSLFLASMAPLAYATYDPTRFHLFYFNATIDGSPAAIGTNISSYINGSAAYGNATPSQLLTNTGNGTIVIQGDNGTNPQEGARDGDIITFKLNGVLANSTPTTLTYAEMSQSYINLSAASPAANASLVSPANNSNFSTMDINFTFKFESATYSIMNCLLGVDGAVRNNNSSAINNTNTVLNSTTSPGRHYWNVTCTNTTETVSSAIRNFTVDTAGPNITSAAVTDPDIFYSTWSGNEVAHLRVSATDQYSDVSYITANFSNVLTNVSLAIFNLTYNSSSGYWEYPYNLSANISWYRANGTLNASSPVLAHSFVLSPVDSLGNHPDGQPSYIEVLLHDLGAFQGPPAGMRACFHEGTEAEGQTNFTKVSNFNAVNLVMIGSMNGSQECAYNMTGNNQSMPWNETFKTLGKFNFSSVNISTLQQASTVMGAMGSAIQIQIAPPHSFRPSRIFVNTTLLAALNTTTSVTMYDLPFSSRPNITYDDGAANVNITWAQGGFDPTYNSLVGNLTMSVSSFSGYNITDEVAPTITMISPVNYYNSSSNITINYTVNGTGTEVSFVRLEVKNYSNFASMYIYTYNATGVSNLSCDNASAGSEVRNCYRSISLGGGTGLVNGSYLFNISVWDFGTPPLGNTQNTVQYFTLDNVTPSIVLVYPENNSNLTNGNVTFQFNVTDVPSTVMCSLLEDGSPTSAPFSAVANGSATSWNVSHPNDGSHTWSVNCTDGVGLSNTSETRVFLVDTTAPALSIATPVDNSLTTNNTTSINFTATDAGIGVSACQYKLNNESRVNISGCANVSDVNLSSGVNTIVVFANDTLGNERNATVSILYDTSGTNVMLNNSTSVSTNNTQVTMVSTSPAASITMSSTSTNVTLNVSAVYNSSTFIATMPSTLNVTANTTLGSLLVQIPANTTVTGASDWSGALTLPYIKSTASYAPTPASGYTASVSGVVEVGLPSIQLNFSNSVRILVPGKAGAYAGFTREGAGSVTAITTVCNGDSQSAADSQLSAGGECKIDSGSDLVIWTKHFTQFITYTQTAIPGTSGGSTPGNGGGNVGGGASSASSQYASEYTLNLGTTSCLVRISRSIDSSTSASTLTTTIVNAGGDGCALSEFVFSDTIPLNFANTSEITFSTQYSSQNGQAVTFSFPSFAPGESKTLAYSVSRWARTSSVSNFTAYSMSAKSPAPAVPSAQQQNATPAAKNETPMPGSERDSHGCYVSEGYAWCAANGRCLGASEPCIAPELANPEAPAAPEKPKQPDNTLQMAIAAIVVLVLLWRGIVLFRHFLKYRKGLGG